MPFARGLVRTSSLVLFLAAAPDPSFGRVPLAGGALAASERPMLFPPLPNGVREMRDERDVAPYLAAWKAASMARVRAAAQPATANQQAWDARWYDLNLTFTPGTSSVAGTVRMKATVVTGPVSVADLDLYSNMVVDGATSGGVAATWSRVGNVLTLNLDHAYSAGETFDVTVTYHGNPTAAGYFGYQSVNGRQLIWSLCLPRRVSSAVPAPCSTAARCRRAGTPRQRAGRCRRTPA